MTTDRELDARLAAAGGIRDEDLPALPDSFLAQLKADSADRPRLLAAAEPASVLAARQLVTDAHEARTQPTWRGHRRLARRSVALLATAAVGVTALAIATGNSATTPDAPAPTAAPSTDGPTLPGNPPNDLGPLAAPPGGLALAATSGISFPYTLQSPPADLSVVYGMYGGLSFDGYEEPVTWIATYRASDDPGFAFRVSTGDPRIPTAGSTETVDATTTDTSVTVAGLPGDLVTGDYDSPSCGYAPSTPQQDTTPDQLCADSFAQLTWQRADGTWVQVTGEDRWATSDAVVKIGESIIDKPQEVPLAVALAPAGWEVSAYEDNAGLTLVNVANPSEANRISISLTERWRGYTTPDVSDDAQGQPIENVTVNGGTAQLTSVPTDESTRMWILEFLLPDGVVAYLTAPDSLTRDQVLQIAGQVTYTP